MTAWWIEDDLLADVMYKMKIRRPEFISGQNYLLYASLYPEMNSG